MAQVFHKDIPSVELHETLHLDAATTADSGKIITPHPVNAGVSEFRYLRDSDLTGRLTMYYLDAGAVGASQIYATLDTVVGYTAHFFNVAGTLLLTSTIALLSPVPVGGRLEVIGDATFQSLIVGTNNSGSLAMANCTKIQLVTRSS
ncbi:MAG: hypothetical protein M0P95_17775 [Sulfuritalea sp.]|jgi:hypothetical protein|nr:hypothetical protein [Sulfuritalea sp.]